MLPPVRRFDAVERTSALSCSEKRRLSRRWRADSPSRKINVVQAQQYDWLANALRELREVELRRDRQREQTRRALRRMLKVGVIGCCAALGVYLYFFYLAGNHDYETEFRIALLGAGGEQLDVDAVSLFRPDGPDGYSVRLVKRKDGTYWRPHTGPLCAAASCRAQWEIQAPGYEPATFNMVDHCARWRGEECLSMRLTATLTPASAKPSEPHDSIGR